MDEAIARYVRRYHQLLIGETNAELIKIEAGTAVPSYKRNEAEIHIRGRDLRQGRPKGVVLSPLDVAEALAGPVEEIAGFIKRALEDLVIRGRQRNLRPGDLSHRRPVRCWTVSTSSLSAGWAFSS